MKCIFNSLRLGYCSGKEMSSDIGADQSGVPWATLLTSFSFSFSSSKGNVNQFFLELSWIISCSFQGSCILKWTVLMSFQTLPPCSGHSAWRTSGSARVCALFAFEHISVTARPMIVSFLVSPTPHPPDWAPEAQSLFIFVFLETYIVLKFHLRIFFKRSVNLFLILI